MLVKAPYIVTMTGSVIENGAIRTEGDRIAEVGVGVKATKADATIKLDDCILMPGLVNAHGHLDLSYLAGTIAPSPSPPPSFDAWVGHIIAARQRTTDAAITAGLRTALQHCYQSGITCVGDHIGHLQALPFLLQMPLKGRAFLEIIGPSAARAGEAVAAAHAAMEHHRKTATRMTLSCTPHAPHTVDPGVLKLLCCPEGAEAPVSIHVAESQEEWDCFTAQRGALFHRVTDQGFSLKAPCRSPIAYLEQLGAIPRDGLLIHCNYLNAADFASIKDAGATIVHCPQSHRSFRHDPFPLRAVREAGIPVCLGTDSLASAPTLNLLTEMALVKEHYPELPAAEILAMATIHGARALGMGERCGAIAPGLAADLIAVRIVDPARDPYENVLRNTHVPFVVIDGRIVRNVLKGDHGI